MIIERAIAATRCAISRRRVSRTVVVALFATLLQIISGSLTPASAVGTPVVTVPAGGWVISQSTTTTISGASVSGLGSTDTYLITISLTGSVNGATLKLGTTTNLTASYGYTSGANTFTSFTKISFTGVAADVNNGLASLQYVAGTAATSGTTPTITISAVENISGLAYNPANNHYYKAYQYNTTGVTVGTDITDKKQSTAITWAGTKSFAGQSGYLVTITSSTEDSFVSATIPSAQNIWIGAKDNWSGGGYTFGEGYWGWVSPGSPEYGAGFSYDSTASSGVAINSTTGRFVSTGRSTSTSYTGTNTGISMSGANGGSSNGYFNWCSNEPNNADGGNGGEHSAVTNWGGGTCWNDLHENNNSAVSGFVVEWGTNAADGGFTNAVSASAKVYLAPTISRLSANNQIAQVSTAYPNSTSVQLVDAMGTAIPNATITWSVTRGIKQSDTSTTNVNGIASQSQWTMPSTIGLDTLTASFSGGGNPSISYTARVSNFPASNADTDTALTFASGRYAWRADDNVFDISNAISIEAWVYQTASVGAGWNMVVNKEESYELGTVGGTWWFGLKSTTWSGQDTGVTSRLNVWQHVALTRAASTNTVNFYVDGQLVWTGSADGAGTTNLANSPYPFTIGGRSSNGTDFGAPFTGMIDEVKIFSSARTAAEIKADMHSYGPVNHADLAVYYDFNEGAGTGLFNRKSSATYSSDLAVVNANTWTDVKSVTANGAYTITKFSRSYLTAAGGWKVPSRASRVSAVIVGGGGGGGSRAGGGGGAGGYVYRPVLSLTPGSIETITVGQGGQGGYSEPAFTNRQGKNGQDSQMGSHSVAVGGGGGGGAGDSGNTYRVGVDGGSGGAASGAIAGDGSSAAYGLATQSAKGYGLGNPGGSGMSGTYWNGGGGGGSGGVGSNASTTSWVAGNGGAGTLDPVGLSNLCLAAGGGGGTVNGGTSSGSGGSCSSGTVTAGAGTIGASIAGSALANSGSGGGGSGYNTSGSDVGGGDGGSGVIIIRWITASVPSYTKPVNAYLNVGMTETFTTNVMSDSATVSLTRTFRWESTTTGANGTFSLIKQGTGAANAVFSWVPTDTSTSGSNYLYRLIVTDSDTAGLFITDSSTAFAVINRTLVMTGVSIIKKAINVSRTDTYTVTFGTPNYNVTLLPVIAGITLDTSTITSPVIRIADTATVGTYYETLTVTDSVSASVVIPLTITISAPPNLLNTAEIVTNDLILNLDAGNSASLIADSGTATTGISWKDLSGSRNNGATGAGVNTGASGGTACTAPTYSSANAGSLTFAAGSNNCYYVSTLNPTSIRNNYTVEVWFKTSATLSSNMGLMSQSTLASNSPYFLNVGTQAGSALYVSFWDNVTTTYKYANCGYTPTIGVWTHIAGTYDGTTMSTYINGQLLCSTPVTAYSPTGTPNNSGLIIGNIGNGATTGTFPGSIASVRVYKSVLNATQLLANFNATKFRFDSSNDVAIVPTKKYGASTIETFTVTSGSDTRTITFSVGDRNGIDWDTSTVANQVKLTLQESLTVGTYLDTVTVTDVLGQSTYIPFRMTTTKADTLTVTMSASTTITYNGSALAVYPKPMITGLKWTDTATTISRFSSAIYSETTTVPTNADTYTVRGSVPTFTIGSLDNYLGIIYDTATATINKANQKPLNIYMYGGTVGTPYLIWLQGGSGTGVVNETLTGVATLTGCAISNHYLTAAEQKQGYCEVRVVKDGDQNYWSETQTVQLYFMAYINSQPSGVVGSGNGIGINGVTSYTVDTTTPPSITGLSTLTLSIAGGGTFVITGTGFGASGLTVKFWRNKVVTPTGSTSTTITFNVSDIGSAGATTGRITVITVNGQDFSTDTLTITP